MRWARASRTHSRATAGAPLSAGWKAAGWWRACPSHVFKTEEGDVALKCPTETIITDRREKELADLGFAPLVHCKGTDYAAFFSVQTCQKPRHLRHRRSQRERAAVGAVALHDGGLPFRALSEVDDARQDRQLHVAQGLRDFPEQLDRELCDRRRHGARTPSKPSIR